jgi:hypothetical protein
MGVGFVVSCLNLGFNWIENMNEFCILLFWLLCAGAMSAMMFLGLPKRGRFTLDSYRSDLSQKRAKQKNKK